MTNEQDPEDTAVALAVYYALRLFSPYLIEEILQGRASRIPWHNLLPRDPDDLEAEVERQREGKPS